MICDNAVGIYLIDRLLLPINTENFSFIACFFSISDSNFNQLLVNDLRCSVLPIQIEICRKKMFSCKSISHPFYFDEDLLHVGTEIQTNNIAIRLLSRYLVKVMR